VGGFYHTGGARRHSGVVVAVNRKVVVMQARLWWVFVARCCLGVVGVCRSLYRRRPVVIVVHASCVAACVVAVHWGHARVMGSCVGVVVVCYPVVVRRGHSLLSVV
jgi:hypothetical protein